MNYFRTRSNACFSRRAESPIFRGFLDTSRAAISKIKARLESMAAIAKMRKSMFLTEISYKSLSGASLERINRGATCREQI